MSEQPRSSAAERLLDTAARLFYARGVSNVGINEIIARAGVARMTLYHHFPSKEALVKAVLERRQAERDEWLAQAPGLADEPLGRMLAVFDLFVEWAQTPDFRGSPLVSATFELGGQLNTARPYAQEHARNVEEYFARQAREAGLHDPEGLAVQLTMLLEGASVYVVVTGDASAAELAKSAAASLIAGAADD
ncbi:MAG TPA: TetR/AcrR family transcriptional regulator [Trueperaceae bacterium]